MTIEEFNLSKFKYVPNTYDSRKLEDLVTMKTSGNIEVEISFPVTIERAKMPVLVHRTSNVITDRVTVITKTFLR